jgi:hypothetical protein
MQCRRIHDQNRAGYLLYEMRSWPWYPLPRPHCRRKETAQKECQLCDTINDVTPQAEVHGARGNGATFAVRALMWDPAPGNAATVSLIVASHPGRQNKLPFPLVAALNVSHWPNLVPSPNVNWPQLGVSRWRQSQLHLLTSPRSSQNSFPSDFAEIRAAHDAIPAPRRPSS